MSKLKLVVMKEFFLRRRVKDTLVALSDFNFILLSFWMAVFTRFYQLEYLIDYSSYLYLSISSATLFVFICWIRGVYKHVLRHAMNSIAKLIVSSLCIVVLFLGFTSYFNQVMLPRTLPILFFCFSFILTFFSRFVVVSLIEGASSKGKENIIVYGAGKAGRQLVVMLQKGELYNAKAFIDDNPTLVGRTIVGVKVYSPKNIAGLKRKYGIQKAILSIPSAPKKQKAEAASLLSTMGIDVLTIPNLDDLVLGIVKIDELKEVAIEDLLGRIPVAPTQKLLEANIKGKVVMVTGAGGSIGSELCRQIIKNKPRKLVLYELSEFALYQIDKELNSYIANEGLDSEVIPLLGSVQRQNRLSAVMNAFKVNTVYHAAAYKHVPLVEHNVVEGVRNNVFGTYYTAMAAIESGVESFVLISTDKAVRPTNVMGATKRLAELGLQALAEQQLHDAKGTRFCMVRFGNVLGSSGSVVPLFKQQIEHGGPITLTHPEITRYFMTIPEAAQLVIQAGAMGKGGDVFVLDMGESVKIIDLAKNLINLSGLEVRDDENPDGDIEIRCTGLRPGEKLYEELLIGDNVKKTSHERIMTAHETYLPLDQYQDILCKLDEACHNFEHDKIRSILLEAPTGFKPTDGICDLVWKANL
ncbi:polysaccharide biosynthesis protein [Vibrio alginolyticus]|uniref:polysaccharide biosynthesis protein n=3 Tax=Vibrionaceae TaxID=641 RepID=UPI003A8DDAF1